MSSRFGAFFFLQSRDVKGAQESCRQGARCCCPPSCHPGSCEIKTESLGCGGSQSPSTGRGLFVLFSGGMKDAGSGRKDAMGQRGRGECWC